jgi:hypothetical protein
LNETNDRESVAVPYIVGILGTFLIVALLVWFMHRYTETGGINEERKAARGKALVELRAADTEALENTAWIDPNKGLVRLRVQDAMKLVEREWRNPAAARSNLLARVEKATAVPPAAPAQPSPFE